MVKFQLNESGIIFLENKNGPNDNEIKNESFDKNSISFILYKNYIDVLNEHKLICRLRYGDFIMNNEMINTESQFKKLLNNVQ